MSGRQQRALRGTAAAALAVFVAAWFHAAVGGATPTPLALVASFILASPACVLLAGRRPRLWRLIASVALSQFAFHTLFGLGQPSTLRFSGDTEMAGMPGMTLHVAAGSAPAGFDLASMWAGHLAAAVITIGAVRFSERALRRTLELAARFLVRALRLVTVRALPRMTTSTDAALPSLQLLRLLCGAVRHRGPPTNALLVY
jgi:hypothetical protein